MHLTTLLLLASVVLRLALTDHSQQRSVILLNKKFHAESAKKQRSPRRRPVANAARNIMVSYKSQ